MKIVGWTEWDNPKYKEMFPIGGECVEAEIEDAKKSNCRRTEDQRL